MIETLESRSETGFQTPFRRSESSSPYQQHDVVLSHQIQESWEISHDTNGFSGRFYCNDRQIGVIDASYIQTTLTFHTCHFKAIDGSIAKEILARAILFGKELSDSRGKNFDTLYKYYLLSPNDQTQEDWGGNAFKEQRRVIDMKYNAIFRGLGFIECPPKNYGSQENRRMSDQHPMQADQNEVISFLKRSWKDLFYENRVKRFGLDWLELTRVFDWKSFEDQWYQNYERSRDDLRAKGIEIKYNGLPVCLS